MNEWEKLFKQAEEKLVAAKALLEGDEVDMEQVNALRDEAKSLSERAEALKATEEELKAMREPVMPADLPTEPEQGGAEELTPEQRQAETVKAVYAIRYGDPDAAIKAVLTDLHGPNFEAKRWAQWGAFNRYIRNVNREPTGEDYVLLKEVILTPDAAKAAIMSGLDVKVIKTTMVEAADTLGGYVVPVDFQARVIERLMGMTVVRGRAFVMNTSRDSVEIPVATGGDSQYTSAVRGTWVDESPTAGGAATNLTFGMEKIAVNTYMAETFLSRNLIEDAAFDLANYLAIKFAEAAAVDEDNSFLVGDGVGKPQGLLPGSANTLSLTAAASGNASTLTWDGLIELAYSIDAQYRMRAAWIMEKASAKIIRKLKDGEGQYLWEPNNQAGQPAELLGFPVLEQEIMPTVAAGAFPILFGDLQGYNIVDRVGMTVERYLDSATARINTVCYVMRRRLGGQATETWRFAVQEVSAS